MSGEDARPRLGSAADLLCVALLVGAPLSVGTVHLSTWSLAFGTAILAWILAVQAAGPRLSIPPTAIRAALILWGSVLLIQLLPLPQPLLAFLSPQSAALREGAGLVGAAPIHLAPGEGAFRVLRWGTVVAACGAFFGRSGSRVGRRRLELTVLVAAAVAFTVGGLHTLLGERAVFGLYQPVWEGRSGFLSPLLNDNHWGAYLSVVGPVGLGAAMKSDSSPARAVLGTLVATAAVVGVFAGTARGAALSLCLALGLFVVLEARAAASKRVTSPKTRHRRLARATAGLVLLLLVGGIALLQIRRETGVVRALDTGEVFEGASLGGKLEQFPDALRLAADFPWTGIGSGAFLDVFTGYREWTRPELSSYVEDLPLQLVADHGFLAGGALFLSLVLLAGMALKRAVRHPSARGPAAALAALLVHELVDFSVETGAVTLTATALLALSLKGSQETRGPAVRLIPLGAVVAAILLMAPALPNWRLDAAWTRAKAGATTDGAVDWDQVARVMDRERPASYVVSQDLALGYARAGQYDEALRRLSRAQALAPRHTDPHLYAARVLRRMGALDQSLLEYRLALGLDWRFQGPAIVREVADKYPGEAALLRLLPPEDPSLAPRVAYTLYTLNDPRADAIAEAAGRLAPDLPLTGVVVGRRQLLAGDRAQAVETLNGVLANERTRPWVRARAAETLWWAGAVEPAVAEVTRLLKGPLLADSALWLTLGRWEVERGREREARMAFRRARSGGTPAVMAAALLEEARMEAKADRLRAAVALLERALLLQDDSLPTHLLAAELLTRLGQQDRARSHQDRARLLGAEQEPAETPGPATAPPAPPG